MFAPHFPHMFPNPMIHTTTKDRTIEAYDIVITDQDIVTRYFSSCLYRTPMPITAENPSGGAFS